MNKLRSMLWLGAVLGAAACNRDSGSRSTTPDQPILPTAEATPAMPETRTAPEPGDPSVASGSGLEDDQGPAGGAVTFDDVTAGGSGDDPILAGGSGARRPSSAEAGREVMLDPGADDPQAVREAVAVINPTKGSKVRGTVRFRDNGSGLEVTTDVTGLPAGKHAYHVHVYGDCSSPDGESAGPHFHFGGSSLAPEEKIITGDLGELQAARKGAATHTATIPMASLQGPFSLVGRAVVVHEKGNDPSKTPDGGAGKRLACGVIGVALHPDAAVTTPATPATGHEGHAPPKDPDQSSSQKTQ